MSDDKYNGWTNRETWALNLWLTNDQGLYEMTLERVKAALAEPDVDDLERVFRANTAGEAVKGFWEELTDPDEQLMTAEAILSMVKDVGSDYRVDWYEIGEHWLTDAEEDES